MKEKVSAPMQEQHALLQEGKYYPSSFAILTSRERDVLREVSRGLPNKEIAVNLGISEHTVKVHVRNLLRKLQVRSRVAAAVRWLGKA